MLRKLRRKLARRLPVEANGFQRGTQPVQPLEVVGRRIADRGIEAAFALARGQYVPQAEAVREEARQAVGVRQ
jgi:hypothetical protein